jgi:predicted DNA-binding protein with PD1-like motif
MKVFNLGRKAWLVRFDYGEEVTAGLLSFAKQKRMQGAIFSGIGALKDPQLAYYDLVLKQYTKKKFRGIFEAAGFDGNLAVLDNKPVFHIHVVLGDKNLRSYAGHFVSGFAGGTLEVTICKTMPLKRAKDRKTGLNLLF